MKTNLLKSTAVVLFLITSLLVSGQTETPMAESFAGGDGTKDDPYQISNLGEWRRFAGHADAWDSCFILTADIDATETNTWKTWGANPDVVSGINPTGWNGAPFTGSLEGNFHTVKNIFIERDNAGNMGIFGATLNANISNIIFDSTYVKGGWNSGVLIGKAKGNDTITNVALTNMHFVSSENASSQGSQNIGGFIGVSEGGPTVINGCIVSGEMDINAATSAALAGNANKLEISDCFTDVTLNIVISPASTAYTISGFLGKATSCEITNSFSVSSFIYTSMDPLPCVFIGENTQFGGVNTTTASACYYNSETTGENILVVGNDEDHENITGLTTYQFKSSGKFPEYDFDNTWAMSVWKEGSMPVQQWYGADAAEDVIISVQNLTQNNGSVKIYPTVLNKHDNINIELDGNEVQVMTFELFDICGKKIYSKNISDPAACTTTSININKAGVYVLFLSDENGLKLGVEKIIVR